MNENLTHEQMLEIEEEREENNKLKQIIVIRKDLNMRKGKMIAQGAHASMKVVLENFESPKVKEWLNGLFTKVAVSVDSEEELLSVYENAKRNGVICSIITDIGLTEFNNIPTKTCVAIGPETHNQLQPITGHLKLL